MTPRDTSKPWSAVPGHPFPAASLVAPCGVTSPAAQSADEPAHSRELRPPRLSPAFTLIELLVVIAIMGILAAMIIGVYPAVQEKSIRRRVQAERDSLVLAIEAYKKDQGFYPPDNRNNPMLPPLFYELVGTTTNGAAYLPLSGEPPVGPGDLAALGVAGFVNVSRGEKPAKNYLPDLRANQHQPITPNSPVHVLDAPGKGPAGDLNPWGYNSSAPRRNVESFDLWAVVRIGSKVITNGNWRD